jgi:hypothetical protein
MQTESGLEDEFELLKPEDFDDQYLSDMTPMMSRACPEKEEVPLDHDIYSYFSDGVIHPNSMMIPISPEGESSSSSISNIETFSHHNSRLPQHFSPSPAADDPLTAGDLTGCDLYQQCIQDSLNQLRTLPKRLRPFTETDLMKFETSENNLSSIRCRIGKRDVIPYQIFPWFQYQLIRFKLDRIRETLDNQQKVDQIVEAMNYFWSRNYDEMELLQLKQIYLQMENEREKKKNVVSRVLEVYRIFKLYCDEIWESGKLSESIVSPLSSPQHPTPHIDPLASLNERVTNLESYVGINDQISPGSKRVRVGGDRASWYPIRKADYSSRARWCTPGSVFGLYADGVGPLRSKKNSSLTWTQIVVYSTAPDTEEEHPNPKQPDRYVLIVMVGSRSPLPSPPLPLSHCLSDRRSSSSIETKSNREVEETALHLPPLREPGGRGQCPSN